LSLLRVTLRKLGLYKHVSDFDVVRKVIELESTGFPSEHATPEESNMIHDVELP
jgi:hypothetical protein